MTDSAPTFDDELRNMKALSAKYRADGEALIARSDKMDTAIATLLDEVNAARSSAAMKEELQDTSSLAPAKGIAPHTIRMMAFIMETGDTPVAKIQAFMETLGKENYDSLRSQLASFAEKNRGWLIRVKKGIYRITPLGAEKCGLKYEARHAA